METDRMILETRRLLLREMVQGDCTGLCKMMKDRDGTMASQKTAERNGMEQRGSFIKHYYGMEMPHLIYSIKKLRQTGYRHKFI